MTFYCHGCGTELPPKKRPSGRDPKWCSDRCRRDTSYGGTCVHCGGRTNGNGGPGTASDTCHTCAARLKHENRQWTRETIVAAIRRWADEHGGVPPSATDWNPTRARERGRPQRGEGFPATPTVQHEFGSWRAAILAAGFDSFKPGQYGRDGEDPAIVAQTVALYRSGLSLRAVGDRLGVSDRAVWHRLKKAGEPRRSMHAWRDAA